MFGRRSQTDFEDEIRSHLDLEKERLERMGMSEADAIDFEFASISRVTAEALEGAGRFAAGAGRHGAPS